LGFGGQGLGFGGQGLGFGVQGSPGWEASHREGLRQCPLFLG